MRLKMKEAEPDIPGVIAPPPLIALATLLLGLALDWLTQTFVLRVLLTFYERIFIGALLVVAGGVLAIVGERTFRALGTNVQPWKPSLKLATSGIYAWLRNPMYVGLGLLTAGFGIALASDWTLVLLLPAAILLHRYVVLREESYLEEKFGDAYRQYKKRVPRYGWPL
jgi:protein-S-isoprenylcysteine O-methyltransferase Ste14